MSVIVKHGEGNENLYVTVLVTHVYYIMSNKTKTLGEIFLLKQPWSGSTPTRLVTVFFMEQRFPERYKCFS